MLIAFLILASVAYLQAGYQMGRASADVWDEKDNASTKSFLLFPTSHMRGTVGHGSCLYSQCGTREDEQLYLVGMALGWPIKLAWNAAAVAFLGPAKLYRLYGAEREELPPAPEARSLPEGSPVQRIAALLEERKRIDGEIEAQRSEVLAAIETEEIANPEVRDVIERGLKS